MESLSEEVWDVVIAGTGLQQSLLALSLSRSGKRILHLDRNEWYGGIDAGLSLKDVEIWEKALSNGESITFFDPLVEQRNNPTNNTVPRLGPSKSYTLALRPQVIYAKSALLTSLVASQVAPQLEFVAVGACWVLRKDDLHKIPSTREDVFNDDSLSMRDKRSLMKLLRFVLQEDDGSDTAHISSSSETLEQLFHKYKIPSSLYSPIQALALSTRSPSATSAAIAVKQMRRHLQSMGHLGAGFGAVIAKYGSNPEIAQTACRAQAVGGGVYLLGHGLKSVEETQTSDPSVSGTDSQKRLLKVSLSDGTIVNARRVVGALDDLPSTTLQSRNEGSCEVTLHNISIVPRQLKTLFTPIAENTPTPAAVVVLVEAADAVNMDPIYLQVHSEDTGECPSGQSIIYASARRDAGVSVQNLKDAVANLLSCLDHSENNSLPTEVLWSMSYASRGWSDAVLDVEPTQLVTVLKPNSFNPALDDGILKPLRVLWRDIMEVEVENDLFLRFESRERGDNDGQES